MPWTAAYQAPLSMGFSRQEYWSGVSLPSPKAEYRQNIGSQLISSKRMHFREVQRKTEYFGNQVSSVREWGLKGAFRNG